MVTVPAGAILGGAGGYVVGGAVGFVACNTGSGGSGGGGAGTAKSGKITGFTQHGEEQAAWRDGHGVSDSAMNDAVENPQSATNQANGTTKYTGKSAVVVLNNAGKVVTTWATNAAGWRY